MLLLCGSKYINVSIYNYVLGVTKESFIKRSCVLNIMPIKLINRNETIYYNPEFAEQLKAEISIKSILNEFDLPSFTNLSTASMQAPYNYPNTQAINNNFSRQKKAARDELIQRIGTEAADYMNKHNGITLFETITTTMNVINSQPTESPYTLSGIYRNIVQKGAESSKFLKAVFDRNFENNKRLQFGRRATTKFLRKTEQLAEEGIQGWGRGLKDRLFYINGPQKAKQYLKERGIIILSKI